ncbi:MAG: hypothetical protein WEA58_04020 [Balneolaceae bacterium]
MKEKRKSFLASVDVSSAGEGSLVKALSRFDEISEIKALYLVDKVTNLIAAGKSDKELAAYIASETPYSAGWDGSWKYDAVQDWIDVTRDILADQRKANQQAAEQRAAEQQAANSKLSKQFAPIQAGISSNVVIGSLVLTAVVGGALAYKNKKNK